MTSAPLPLFPNYLQLRTRSRVPLRLWSWIRTLMVLGIIGIAGLSFFLPATGLFILWRIVIPVLPLVFLLAPGVWRNVCPLAASNQTPRVLSFSRALTPPAWFKEYGYVIGFVAFFIVASSRKWLFNYSGPATGVLLIAAMGFAFAGGYLFKGKSGWCSSICPLYPVQRLYNQTPFVTVANAHCAPCVGCTKNCYDFNPGVAYLADLYDEDRYYSNYRKFFAAVMPGFIFAYFTIPDPPATPVIAMYLQFALAMIVSAGAFFIVDALVKVSANKLTAVYGAIAINLFYWFGMPSWLNAVSGLFALKPLPWLAWIVQAVIGAATVVWIYRTYRKEPLFLNQLMQTQGEETRINAGAARVLRKAAGNAKMEVTFKPGDVRVLIEQGRTLLEIAESNHQRIESGCRMGVCGSDPVVILEGMENISPLGSEERNTLERLGLGGNARLACMCRVKGTVAVSLNAKEALATTTDAAPAITFDSAIKSIVIIGNGPGGVTAADYARRNHPQCDIHLIGRERHAHYNRMGISRLIYGRSAMSGLYLQSESWYEERKITQWLNTLVTRIDTENRQVILATKEVLHYDRLIMAMGSSSSVPPLAGFGMPGTFVLREAEEAMEIRSYTQTHATRHAVIAGGGLLGLEAGYAIHKLGVHVSVLERGEWLLKRQLDERGSYFLRQYLEALGMEIVLRSEAAEVRGETCATEVALKDGRIMPCDLLLAAVGIKPNVDLAAAAGLKVNRGIVVDGAMRTSAPDVYAAGDVCEYQGQVQGLWTVAIEQAKIATLNAMGIPANYEDVIPVTALKVVGVDVTSIGRFDPQSDAETVIVQENTNEHRYRKLVIADDKIVGAILLGYPLDAPAVTAVVKQGINIRDAIDDLRAGNWEVLRELV